MEVKNMIDRKILKSNIERRLQETEKSEDIGGRVCFKVASGGYLRLDTIGDDYNCLVIEFAENKRDAKNNVFEDGDLLYAEEMSEDEMVEKVKKELREG